MLRIAVCDDSPHTLSAIREDVARAFAGHGVETRIDAFTNAVLLERCAREDPYDIYFLDISMPYDGISLGKRVRALDADACIVFVSGREDLVFDTFAVEPQAFIRKARFRQEIGDVADGLLHRAQERAARGEKITLVSGMRVLRVYPEQIQYIEGVNKNQKVVLSRETVLVRSTMARLEVQLQGKGFIRPHKSYLVNCRCIYSMDGLQITLDDGTCIPVSRPNAAKCREMFFQMLQPEN